MSQTPYSMPINIEIPAIVPDEARVAVWRRLPVLRQAVQGRGLGGLEPSSPFGSNIRVFVYQRGVQGVPLQRLRDVLVDLFGLSIREGALVNMLAASAEPFRAAVSLIKARLLGANAIGSDEKGVRVRRGTDGFPRWPTTPRDREGFVRHIPRLTTDVTAATRGPRGRSSQSRHPLSTP